MRLGARHAFVTRVLPDGRVIDVQPWPGGAGRLVVSAGPGRWQELACYWYPSWMEATWAAMIWDGEGVPAGAAPRPS